MSKQIQFAVAVFASTIVLGVNTVTSQEAGIRQSKSSASHVIEFDPGAGAARGFIHPESTLGGPSSVNPFGELVDPFNPPYGTNQIVSIGAGGHLIVRFQTPILNHPHNLLGLDFTIFGNTGFIITNEFDLQTFDWIGIPATDGSIFGAGTGQIVVSVSRNGREFFVLDPARAPSVDGFPPTDAAGDPGVPVARGLTADDFPGATLADMRTLYGGSAGGASFDLETALDANGRRVFLSMVRYIRVDVLSGRAEIDAFTAVDRDPRGRR